MPGLIRAFDIFPDTMKIKLFLSLLTLAGLCFLGTGCQHKPRPGEVPTLSLKTYSGETFTVSPEDTQVTLLVFWATWCEPCVMEIPTLVSLQEKYRGRGFRVVAINMDDADGSKAQPIMEHFGVNYPVLVGSDEVGNKLGGLWGLPTSFLIGRDGILKDKIVGLAPDGELESKILALL